MKRAAALVAAILAIAFAVVAVVQTLRLEAARQDIETLRAANDGLQSELDTVNGQLTAEQAARQDVEQQLADLQKQQALQNAEQAKANIQDGDEIGRVWVEGTEVDCTLYWGILAISSATAPERIRRMAACFQVKTVPSL